MLGELVFFEKIETVSITNCKGEEENRKVKFSDFYTCRFDSETEKIVDIAIPYTIRWLVYETLDINYYFSLATVFCNNKGKKLKKAGIDLNSNPFFVIWGGQEINSISCYQNDTEENIQLEIHSFKNGEYFLLWEVKFKYEEDIESILYFLPQKLKNFSNAIRVCLNSFIAEEKAMFFA